RIFYVLINTDYNLLSAFYGSLKIIRSSCNFILHKSILYGHDSSSHCVDIIYVLKSYLLKFISKCFNKKRPTKRVNCLSNTAFIGKYLLGAERYFCSFFCRERYRFIVSIGMQGLCAPQYGG